MNYINLLTLLFLFFLNFKLSILSRVSWSPEDLAAQIRNNIQKFIYSFEDLYKEDEQEFLYRIDNIFYYYNLYTYIYYIEEIDYDVTNFGNLLMYYLQNYINNFNKCAFIIMIKDNSQVIIIMGNEYYNKFTKNKSNNINDLAKYISIELSSKENEDDIEYVFDYSLTQLEKALDGKKIEPGKSYTAVIIIVIVIVIIVIIFLVILIKCCKRPKVVSIGYKNYNPLA